MVLLSLQVGLLLLFSHSVVPDSLRPYGLQHSRLPCPSLFPRVCSNSGPLSWWCHPAISNSHPLLLPSSIFPSIMAFSSEFTSGDQNIGASALASALPMKVQGWFSVELTSLISSLFKGLSRVFSSVTVQKYLFFSAQPSLQSSLTSVCDYWKNHSFDYMDLCQQSDVSAF